MKQIIAVAVFAYSSMVYAQCDKNLAGLWAINSTSIELDKNKKVEESPMTWDFNINGKANLKILPFLDVTSNYECKNKSIIIKKTVPATLNIIRISENELVWKEVGDDKFFYFSK